MAAYADRVLVTCTTTGTGDFDLTTGTTRTGYESFNTAFGTSLAFYYAAIGVDASDVPTGEWEVGIGNLSTSTNLVRETVLQSSNSDALVSFSAGTKLLFSDLPASPLMSQGVYNIMLNPMVQL